MNVPSQHSGVAALREMLKTGHGAVQRAAPQPPAPAALTTAEHVPQACIQILQSSWALINDYCGTVCRQLSIGYVFPYQDNPCFVSNLSLMQTVYKYVYQTREHMERLLKRTTPDTLHDVASLFLETLQKLVNILHREMGRPEAHLEASSSAIAHFFADRSRRELIDNGYKQIVTFQDALGYCLLEATKLESTNVGRTSFPNRTYLRN